jgi:hypothetical protein
VKGFTRLAEFFFQICDPLSLGLQGSAAAGNLLLQVPNFRRSELQQACFPGEVSLHARGNLYRLIGSG